MKIVLILLFLSVSPFKDSKIAGDLYLYEYFKIEKELPKSKEMLKSKSLEPYLSEITETMQRIHDLRLQADDIKFHQKKIKVDGEKAKEVSMIFATQMVEKTQQILKSLANMHGVVAAVESLAAMISEQIESVEFDSRQLKTTLGEKKKQLQVLFVREEIILAQLNAKFEDFIELKEKLALVTKKEKLYKAFIKYFTEKIEEAHNLPEANDKLNHASNLKIRLEMEKKQMEHDLELFVKEIESINFDTFNFYMNFFSFIMRFFDKPFEVLLGEDWPIYFEMVDYHICKLDYNWSVFMGERFHLGNEIEVIDNYDVVVDESIIPDLVRMNKDGKAILREMTTNSIFRFPECNKFTVESLRNGVIDRIFYLPVQKHKYDWDIIILFNFFELNIESFCETASYVSHSMANNSAADLNLAISRKFSELIQKEEEERENLWASVLKEGGNKELLDFWKLKMKIEERAFRILTVENEKEFEPTILNIFAFVVLFASFGSALFAVRLREKEKEAEKANKLDDSMSLH